MQVISLLEGWSQRDIGGKSFDKLMQVVDVPLWWFFKRIFIPEVLPKQLGDFDFLEGKESSFFDRSKYYASSLVFGRYILSKERKKWDVLKNFKKESSGKDKVLFLQFSNHINTDGSFFRINKIVNGLTKLEPLVLCLDALSTNKSEMLKEFQALYNYFDEELLRVAKTRAEKLFDIWKEIPEDTKEEMLIASKGSYWPHLKYAFNGFFSKEFLTVLCLYYELALRVIIDERVKCIVLTSQNSLAEKCMMAAAKKLDVPVVLVQHGTLEKPKVNPDLLSKSKLAVFSEHRKQGLMELGVDANDIVVTGPVIFDEIANYSGSVSREEGLNIFIVTSPTWESGQLSEEEYWKRWEKVMLDLKKIPYCKVTVKLHPREKSAEKYRELAAGLDLEVVQDNRRDVFYSLLQKCDVFIHLNSTAVLEGMILDKPTITLEITSGWKNSMTAGQGCAVEATHETDFRDAVYSCLKKEDEYRLARQEFAARMAGDVDGKAYIRVVDLIYELVNNG